MINWQRLKRKCEKNGRKTPTKRRIRKTEIYLFKNIRRRGRIKLFNIDLFNTKSKKEIYDDYKLIY